MFKVGMGVIRKHGGKTGSIVDTMFDKKLGEEIYLVRWDATLKAGYYTQAVLEGRRYIVTEKVIW